MESNELKRGNNNIWLGLLLLMVGLAWLLKSFGTPLPYWLFTWKTFLIALGIGIGFQNQFKGNTWLVLILIGGAFMLEDLYPDLSMRHYLWPVLIIIVGVWLMIRPRGGRYRGDDEGGQSTGNYDRSGIAAASTYLSDDYIDSTSVFGGIKKVILSKDFKGGEVVSIMGGTEIDMTQADINGRVVLDVTQILGGTKLIIPAHWELKSELVSVFGGIEDKRAVLASNVNPEKVLILKGTSILGGIDIRSYAK